MGEEGQGYRQYSRVDVDTCVATATSDLIMMDAHLDPESDNEDDPTKLLNQWLGELNTLKKVQLIEGIVKIYDT